MTFTQGQAYKNRVPMSTLLGRRKRALKAAGLCEAGYTRIPSNKTQKEETR